MNIMKKVTNVNRMMGAFPAGSEKAQKDQLDQKKAEQNTNALKIG